jgi:hypothetical protein
MIFCYVLPADRNNQFLTIQIRPIYKMVIRMVISGRQASKSNITVRNQWWHPSACFTAEFTRDEFKRALAVYPMMTPKRLPR